MPAHPAELMHAAERADHRPISNQRMSAERHAVREYGVISDLHIVRNVGVGHQEIVIADSGDQPAAFRAAMNGDELSNLVAVSNACLGTFALIFQILRRDTHRCVWIEDVIFADNGYAFHIDMRHQSRTLADFDIRSDDAVGSDFSALRDAGLRIDDGSRVNRHAMALNGRDGGRSLGYNFTG